MIAGGWFGDDGGELAMEVKRNCSSQDFVRLALQMRQELNVTATMKSSSLLRTITHATPQDGTLSVLNVGLLHSKSVTPEIT
jgi:hypothetical protein